MVEHADRHGLRGNMQTMVLNCTAGGIYLRMMSHLKSHPAVRSFMCLTNDGAGTKNADAGVRRTRPKPNIQGGAIVAFDESARKKERTERASEIEKRER